MRTALTSKAYETLQQGHLLLAPRKISYRGAIPSNWFTLGPFTISEPFQWNNVGPVAADVNEPFFLLCPLCKTHKHCRETQLLKQGAWKVLNCTRCHRNSTTAKWLCECNIPWYACSVHARQGHAAGSKQPSSTPKRLCDTNTSMYNQVGCSPCPLARSKRQKQGNAPPHIPIHISKPPAKRKGNSSSGASKKRRTTKDSNLEALASVARMRESRTQSLQFDRGLGRSSSTSAL